MKSAPFIIALSLLAAAPAMAQMATSTASDVGSANTRNGYPAGGGAIALPTPAPSVATTSGPRTPGSTGANPVAAGGAASGSISTSDSNLSGGAPGPASGGGSAGGGGRGSGAAASGGAATSGAGRASSGSRGGSRTGSNWVVCPPSGASGLAALFTGTDLSCAPD